MNIPVDNTFKVASRKLFVIVTNANYNDLLGMKYILDKDRKKSFPIFSIEWITLSNFSMPGIVLKYEKDEDLKILETISDNYVISE